MQKFDSIIIGGGFYGCAIASHLAQAGQAVLILELADDLLTRASFNNQARVHNGYHYPRSMLTAIRSRLNFRKFVDRYPSAIAMNFTKLYAVPKILTKVSANQFLQFCNRIGASIKPATDKHRSLFNHQLIDQVYEVEEFAFDANELRKLMREELLSNKVRVEFGKHVQSVRAANTGIAVICADGSEYASSKVFNCTYSSLNDIEDLARIPLKNELTEMALVEVPKELAHVGITVMCGPFFSVMPFPAKGLHSFSHVRYTPHGEWKLPAHRFSAMKNELPRSNFPYMLADASRYVPLVRECRYVESLWELKSVLPSNEADDGRPILVQLNHGMPHVHTILGGKIDNIFDCIDELERRNGEL